MSNDAITAGLPARQLTEDVFEHKDAPALTGSVRVSIVLEQPSAMEAGVMDAKGGARSPEAMRYRDDLKVAQNDVARAISRDVLGGGRLDVVWNITMGANAISANVPAEKLDAIRAIPGVKMVVVETQHTPDVFSKDTADPNMGTSGAMVGSPAAYTAGYTGAGSRIAVIDTGTDTDHISFNADAFEYGLEKNAQAKGSNKDAYIASLNLLDAAEIDSVLSQLNMHERDKTLTGADLYRTSKLAFGYNYIDRDLNITHDFDTASEHGSHVAGIATANKYVPNVDEDGVYLNALQAVAVQGVAPDAQLITMKVFGRGGGAYDSDYIVAIEDAILLGCDAINLSLGSDNGLTMSIEYQAVLDMLSDPAKNGGAVVSISAGNSGTWGEYGYMGAAYGANIYSDNVNFQMVGTPSTYANSLSIASVDNVGQTGPTLQFNGTDEHGDFAKVDAFYMECNDPGPKVPTFEDLDISPDGSGTPYNFVFTFALGSAEDFAALSKVVNLRRTIVLCQRGTLSFTEKATNAYNAGADGTLIFNNEAGKISPTVTGYNFPAPVGGMTLDDAKAIMKIAEPVYATENPTKDDVPVCYVGTVTIRKGTLTIAPGDAEAGYTMSSFSSWGAPGSLTMKPEITAPGGNIYSVDGQTPGGQAYESMSGTSMAAPQVTGMTAVVAQYIRETYTDSNKDGLLDGLNVTQRQLIQSLLMSTAEPIMQSFGEGTNSVQDHSSWYSILNQGSGLGNVGNAVTAHSFILMGEDATASYADGKVKAELGDDPEKTGVYKFTFSLNNLTGSAATYDLSANWFTQNLYTAYGMQFMDTWTAALKNAATTFKVDGAAATSVTVPANGSKTVEVTVDVTGCASILNDYPVGAYIEGFVFVEEQGSNGTNHSIPVLGFYGNWTDASMFEVSSYLKYIYGLDTRPTYIYSTSFNYATNYLTANVGALGEETVFGGNLLYFDEDCMDDTYNPLRNAMNSENGDSLGSYYYTLIRNAGASAVVVKYQLPDSDTPVRMYLDKGGPEQSAFYYYNGQSWVYTQSGADVDYDLSDENGDPLPEGTQVIVSLVMAPEYYGVPVAPDPSAPVNLGTELTYDWDDLIDNKLGDGAFMSTYLVVDNTAPDVTNVAIEGTTVTVTAKDNQYLAAIAIYNEDGSRLVTYDLPNQAAPDTAYTASFDMSDFYGTRFYVVAYDYALNTSTHAVTADEPFDGSDYTDTLMMVDARDVWSAWDGESDALTPVVASSTVIPAAAYADGYIFAVDENGLFSVTDPNNVDSRRIICDLGMTVDALTYSTKDQVLYALAGGSLYTVDKLNGELELVGEVAITAYDGAISGATSTLAVDNKGNFYSIGDYDSVLYTYTVSTLNKPKAVGKLDFFTKYFSALAWWDGKLYTPQYFTGFDPMNDDLNNDFEIDEGDAQAILDYCSGVDPDNFMVEYFGDFSDDGEVTTYDAHVLLKTLLDPVQKNLMAINPATAEYEAVCAITAPLYALVPVTAVEEAPEWAKPAEEVTGVVINPGSLEIYVGDTQSLVAYVSPWTLTDADKAVVWTSSDPTVVTVNTMGVVTSVKSGEADITATSVKDDTKSATIHVVSKNVEYTLYGDLMNTKSETELFKYNLETDVTWTSLFNIKEALGTNLPLQAAADGYVESYKHYISSAYSDASVLWTIDFQSGNVDNVVVGTAFADMATSQYWGPVTGKELMVAVDTNGLFYGPFEPSKADKAKADFIGTIILSSSTGADGFVAVASAGYTLYVDDWGPVPETKDAELFYVLDSLGYMWSVIVPYGSGDMTEFRALNVPSAPKVPFGEYVSLIATDDGEHLFLANYEELRDTAVIYMLTEWEEYDGIFDTKRVGNMGGNVWPAALTWAEKNEDASAGGGAGGGASGDSVTDMWRFRVAADGTVESWKDHCAEVEGASGATSTKSTVTVDLKATESTNGLLSVEYDPDVLTVDGVATNEELALISYSVDEDEGVVTLAYAQSEAVTGVAATITFAYDPKTVPDGTIVYINVIEDGMDAPNKTQRIPLEFRASSTTPVPPQPTEPSTGTTDPGTTTTTTTDEDGNVTTTVTASDGTVTETVKEPDGTVTETVTASDGTVTETVTETDGTVTETVTEPDGTVTETVTDTEGTVTETVTGTDGTVTETVKDAEGGKVQTVTTAEGDKAITVTNSEGEQIISVKLPATFAEPETGFIDVPEEHWAEDAINNMAALGLVKGVDEEERVYDMVSNVTRSTMATVLFRLSHGSVGMDNPFTDVSSNAWYADAVAWAAKAGVVTGYTADTFGPNDTITREQMAVMLYRYAKSLNMGFKGMWMFELDFADADSVSEWAYEAVCWMSMNGVMTGKPGNVLDPGGLVSRAELATVMDRFIGLVK